jgi:hypothetical protein
MRQVILIYFYSFIAPLLIMSFEDAVVSISPSNEANLSGQIWYVLDRVIFWHAGFFM